MRRSNGGIIGPDNVTTGGPFGSASGVFKLSEATNLIKEGKWPTPGPANTVPNSCRFNRESSDSLDDTQGTTNRKTYTVSMWLKRSALGVNSYLFDAYPNASNEFNITCSVGDQLVITQEASGIGLFNLTTNRLFRDVSAWYHVVVAVDTTQGTASNRIKLYVNGVQETSFSTETYPSLNYDTATNNGYTLRLGGRGNATHYFSGYLAEYCFIDGTALTPTSFGEFNSDSGIWIPKTITGLTYGTNGFYLPFQNSAALGQDDSGEGNNFTVNNLTSIDQSTDTPSNNFATLNPLNQGLHQTGVFTNGNLEFESTQTGSSWPRGISSIGKNSGKWYMEMKMLNSESVAIGISNGDGSNSLFADFTDDIGYNSANGSIYQAGSGSAYGDTFTTNDIIGIALDLDNNKLYFAKNDTWQNSGVPTSGATGTGAISVTNPSATGFYFFTVGETSSAATPNVATNFGNAPYTISSGNADGNGFGNFEYAPPSGYLSLCTNNLNAV